MVILWLIIVSYINCIREEILEYFIIPDKTNKEQYVMNNSAIIFKEPN